MKFKLVEAAESKICCICKKPFDGYGNNAEPVCSGTCCDECNMKEVIPARMKMVDNSSSKELNEDLEDYKLTYYLSTATAERRPETIEDVENDWKEEVFAADSDYDALLYALELIDSGYDDTDFSTAEEIIKYFEEKDLGDGSAFVVKLEGPNGVIYDMGQTKDDFIEQVKENDKMLNYYKSILGIDESLNEGNSVSSKIPPALDSFLQDIAQMYGTIDYGDIMDHDYTEDDIRQLNNLRRSFITWSQYDEDDEEVKAKFNEIANKVAEILKRVNSSRTADIIPIEYDALTFVQYGNRIDVDDREEFEYTTKWTYDVDKNDLYTFIFEECIDAEDFPDAFADDFDPSNDKDWEVFTNWLDAHYDEIFTKYRDKILNHYEEEAMRDAAANYNDYDYSIFDDPDWSPGSHHDVALNEAAEEDVLRNAYDQLRAYAIKDPRFFREHTIADAINELSERGILEIPAAYCVDLNNCTEEEADAFINDMIGYINNWRRLKLYYPIVDDSLDENINAETQNMYAQMKQWLQENDYIDGYDFAYDGEYAEFVDTLYLEALQKLQEETGDESIFVEPSIQGGQGSVFMFADGKNDASWDFEAECETLLDYANKADTANEFVDMIFEYLKAKYNSMTNEFDDDDAEYIEEAINPTKALEVKKNSDADVIFYGYQYKNEKPVILDPPEELSDVEYEDRVARIVADYNKLDADKPTSNRYAKEHDFIFYTLYNRKDEALNESNGAEFKDAFKSILNVIAKDDKKEWMQTADNIVSNLPEDDLSNVIDAILNRFSNLKLSQQQNSEIAKAAGQENVEADNLGQLIDILNIKGLCKEDPKAVKSVLVVVLYIIGIIEPTPVVEIIATIVLALPEDVIAKVVAGLIGFAEKTSSPLLNTLKSGSKVEEGLFDIPIPKISMSFGEDLEEDDDLDEFLNLNSLMPKISFSMGESAADDDMTFDADLDEAYDVKMMKHMFGLN